MDQSSTWECFVDRDDAHGNTDRGSHVMAYRTNCCACTRQTKDLYYNRMKVTYLRKLLDVECA